MKSKCISIKFLTVLFLMVLCLLPGLFQERCMAAEKDTIKIGFIAPLTGTYSDIMAESLKGVIIAVDYINAQGGIKGIKVECIIKDAPDAPSTISECESLISREQVDIIVPSSSATGYTIVPICERAKMINWHVCGGADVITAGNNKYVFRACGINKEEGTLQADFTYDALQRLEISPDEARIAIVGADSVAGVATGDAAEERAKELGMQVVLRQVYSTDTQDLSSLLMRLVDAKPDAVLNCGSPVDTKLFFRQAPTFGFKVPIFIATGGSIGSNWFLETFGKDKVNTFLSTNWPGETTSKEYAPGLEEFMKLYREYTGREHLYSCHSLTSYTSMLFLWDVLERAKSLDSEDIREAALLTDIPINTVGCGWGAKFAPPGDPMMGQNLRAQNVVTQWQDGKLYTAWPLEDPDHKLILPMESDIW